MGCEEILACSYRDFKFRIRIKTGAKVKLLERCVQASRRS